jgi:hypothetical protein
MLEIGGTSQKCFENGDNMCTTASVLMSIALVRRSSPPSPSFLENIMVQASRVHGRVELKYGGGTASAADVFDAVQYLPDIAVSEYIICGSGSSTLFHRHPVTRRNEGTSCFISAHHLVDCLMPYFQTGRTVAAVLTCGGHSTCVSRTDGRYSFFDPMPSLLRIGMTSDEFIRLLGFIVGDQCDVSVVHKVFPS